MPEKISTIEERPYPLCPSSPPKGSIAPPAASSFGSVVGFPSLFRIHPSGTSVPLAFARLIFPAATALVAMSRKNGPSRLLGIAMEIGLVPSLFSRPPNGPTALADRPESAVIIPIISAAAAIKG